MYILAKINVHLQSADSQGERTSSLKAMTPREPTSAVTSTKQNEPAMVRNFDVNRRKMLELHLKRVEEIMTSLG